MISSCKIWKKILSSLTIPSTIPLVNLASCGSKPMPVTYSIYGGSTTLNGLAGQEGSDTAEWVVRNSEGEIVSADFTIESVDASSDLPEWIDIYNGEVYWTEDASEGTYKFKIRAEIADTDPIYSNDITLTIKETYSISGGSTILNGVAGQGGIDEATWVVKNSKQETVSATLSIEAFDPYSYLPEWISVDNDKVCWTDAATEGTYKLKVKAEIVDAEPIYSDEIILSIFKTPPSPITDFQWSYNETNKTATLTKYIGTSANVVIPSSIENNDVTYVVVAIGDSAFFECTQLTSIDIPNSVISIGDSAFQDCQELKSVVIPNNADIGSYAFSNCTKLTSVIIGMFVKHIYSGAFEGCTSLTDTSGPGGSFGFNFLWSIEQWREVEVEKDWHKDTPATKIQCADGTTTLDEFDDYEWSFDEVNKTATLTKAMVTGDVIIPSTVKHKGITYTVISIGANAFFNHEGLTSVIIPDTVWDIEDCAFLGCTSLTSVTISQGVTNISDSAFYNCENITDTSGLEQSPGFKFLGYISQWKSIYRALNWHDNVPATVVQCSDGQCNLDDDTKLDFKWSFDDTNNTAIVVQYIGKNDYAFIPPFIKEGGKVYTVATIYIEAFYLKGNIKFVRIPSTITEMFKYCFRSCYSLTDTSSPKESYGFNFSGTIEQWKKIVRHEDWHSWTPATKIQCANGVCGLDET